MTPAEFKARREALGLSTRWLAERWGVSHLSVQRWERNRAIPAELARDFEAIEDQADATVALGVEREDGSIGIPRTDAQSMDGYPAAYHRAVALRIARETGAELVFRYEGEETAEIEEM